MPHTEPPRQVRELAEQLARDGGQALATYRDPVGDHWQIFCLLPLEKIARFAGGAFAPMVRRVDRFLKLPLPRAFAERQERAALVGEADEVLGRVVAKIRKRGINHPYVKNYVLARATPLTRARKTLPPFEQTFKKLRENLEAFDISKVRYDEIQRSAIMAVPAPTE